MGPCFRGMENSGNVTQRIDPIDLQWGHALGAWKTFVTSSVEIIKAAPSMGPCFRGMENSAASVACRVTNFTFNGAML